MKLREIMTTPIQSIQSGAPMQEAATKMKAANVGMLPVFSGDRMVGVVTDRDLVVRGLTEGRADKRVDEVMTSNPVCCDQNEEVEEAIETMRSQEIGRVVVTDDGGKPVGVVSAGAIAIARGGNPQVGQLATKLSQAHSKH